MVKLYTPTPRAVAMKVSEPIDWQNILSMVSLSVLCLNVSKNNLLESEDLDDVTQNALTKIVASIATFDSSKAALKTWICTIARNCYYDFLRERKAWRLHFEYSSNKDQNGGNSGSMLDTPDYFEDNKAFEADFEGLLSMVVKKLPDTYREAILCLVDEVPAKEMVKRIKCSKKNLRPTICRARRAVREPLTKMGII